MDTHTNSHLSIQYNQPVCVCDIETGANVQPLEESTSSEPIIGNGLIRNEPLVNIPPPPNSDVEVDIPDVQVQVSSSDEDYSTFD